MFLRFLPVLWALLFLSVSAGVNAHLPSDISVGLPKPSKSWKTLETEHFRINFQEEHLGFAQRMAAIAENVYSNTTQWMEWHPEDITEIIINDAFDGSNGGATPLPYNRFFIFMNAPFQGELIDNSPWMELVFTHEFIHILHLDQADRFPGKLRNIFGRIFFTFPQIFSPKWITEGLAVYGETDHEAGFGRGQGAMYKGMMQAEVIKGIRSLTELSYHGYQGTDWPLGQVYLYGYYFMEFVEQEFGKEKINAYIKNWNKNIVPWRLDSRASQVFGVSATTLWARYQHYLRTKFKPMIEKIEAQGVSESIAVAQSGIVNTNPVWMPNGDMYYYHNSGVDHARILLQKAGGGIQTITEVAGFSMFDVHPEKGLLLSRAEICDNTNLYTDLYQQEPDSKAWRKLTTCGRYPRAFWSPDGKFIVAVKVGNGQTSLVLLDLDGVELTLLDMRGLGETIGHFHWSPDGRSVVAAIKREKSGWNLEEYDLYNRTWKKLTFNQHIEYRPHYSADGKYVFFISDQGDALNVRRLHLTTGKIETLTNTLTAILDFSANEAGDAFRVVEYTAEGFAIKEVAIDKIYAGYDAKSKQPPVIKAFANSPDYDPSKFTEVKDYSPWNSMYPRGWWAWLYIDESEGDSIQFITDGNDALSFHYWQVAPQIYYEKEEWGGDIGYWFYNRLALLASRKIDIERDEDRDKGIAEIWDIEQRYQAIYTQPINTLENRFRINLGIAKETVERTFESTGTTSSGENNLLGLLFNWNSTDYYLHSISPESGRDVTFTLEQYDVLGDSFFDGLVKTLDWREFFSLPANNVLGLRVVYAESDGGNNNIPLEMGGNHDSYGTLAAQIGFGLEDFLLRGYSSSNSELIGHKVNVNSLEWRFPVKEFFDGFLIPPVGLGKTSMTLFIDSGAAWDKGESRRYYSSVGAEATPSMLLGYDTFRLDITVGVAQALDSDIGGTEAYLRLFSSF